LITQLDRQNPVVGEKGNMLDLFYNWMLNVSNLSIIVGTGSPEGVVEARQPRQYLQTDGAANQIMWIKKLNDIGGDRTMGWELM
jgi:hypothetical protein